jgi:hypothetical protein
MKRANHTKDVRGGRSRLAIVAHMVCAVVFGLSCTDMVQGDAPSRSQQTSVEGDQVIERRVDAAIRLLLSSNFNEYLRGSRELSEIGSAAVPQLMERVRNGPPQAARLCLSVVDAIGGDTAVPGLEDIISRAPDAQLTPDTFDCTTLEGVSLYAKEVIVHLIEPSSRHWDGADLAAPPATEGFAIRQHYFSRVNDRFHSWKAADGPRTRRGAPETRESGATTKKTERPTK